MYNKYMQGDGEMFSDLYRRVEYEYEKPQEAEETSVKERKTFSLSKLLSGVDFDKVGILPLVLLLLLLVDVDDEEKLIIIILAVIFGI